MQNVFTNKDLSHVIGLVLLTLDRVFAISNEHFTPRGHLEKQQKQNISTKKYDFPGNFYPLNV